MIDGVLSVTYWWFTAEDSDLLEEALRLDDAEVETLGNEKHLFSKSKRPFQPNQASPFAFRQVCFGSSEVFKKYQYLFYL